MSVTTSSTISALNSFLEKAGLEVAQPKLHYANYGTKKTIPQKNSKSMKFRRYERFAPTTGAQLASIKTITEGVNPTDTTPTLTDVTITLTQYGNLVRFTDIAMQTSDLAYPEVELQKRNMENMRQTVDCAYRDGIMGGTNVFRLTDEVGAVSGAARTDVNGKLNAAALDKAIRNLKRSDANFWTSSITASNKIGTSGIRPSYICITHPNAEYDIERIPGFKAVSDYANEGSALEGEFGAYKNMRFVGSTLAAYFADAGAASSGTGNASTSGTLQDVYASIIVGKDAYAVVDLASTMEVVWIPPKAEAGNELGLWATLGWKAMCGSGILNQNWILRVEHSVSA